MTGLLARPSAAVWAHRSGSPTLFLAQMVVVGRLEA
jgi:hypothetical protein